jgi:transposase
MRSRRSQARYDGWWVLQTNLGEEAKVIVAAYKELWRVEDLFRTMKSVLETRPIYHQCDETIRGDLIVAHPDP